MHLMGICSICGCGLNCWLPYLFRITYWLLHDSKFYIPDYKIFLLFWISKICRYDMFSNHWLKETSVPRKSSDTSSVGFIALNRELHVMSLQSGTGSIKSRKSSQCKRSTTLLIQIYNPYKKEWRSLITKPPFSRPLDFKTTVMCTLCV